MVTMEQLEAQLRPYKLALIEAFGLDLGKTSSSISADRDSVTFRVDIIGTELPPNALATGDTDRISAVEFQAIHWTEAQRKAVFDYIAQFPAPKLILKGDLEELRAAVTASGRASRLMALPPDASVEVIEYPTPERVRYLMEARAYAVELGLEPRDVVQIRERLDTFDRFEFVLTDGSVVKHPGVEHLEPHQRRAVRNAGQDIEQIWDQLHDSPAFRPKDWPQVPPDDRDTRRFEGIFRVIDKLEQP